MTTRGFLPLGATDRAMAVVDASSAVTFHVVGEGEGTLDRARLVQAWEWLGLRHPILTAHLSPTNVRAWHPGSVLEQPTLIEVPSDAERRSAVDAAVARLLDVTRGPVAALTVVIAPRSFYLVLSVHHAALDGRAAFVVLDDLRTMYLSGLPLPTDTAPRTAGETLPSSGLPIATRERIVARSRRRWRRIVRSEHSDPAATVPGQPAAGYATMDIGGVLTSLAPTRRRNGWHIDAVFVGLLAAAWADVFGDAGTSGWLLAADFREDLGVGRGVGNMSGTEPVMINAVERDLVSVIAQSHVEIAAMRSSRPGLAPEILASAMPLAPAAVMNRGIQWAWRRASELRYTRVVSNLGILDPELAEWGDARLEHLAFVPPLAHAPYVVFMISTFADTTTVTVRTSSDWLTTSHVGELEAALQEYGTSHLKSIAAP